MREIKFTAKGFDGNWYVGNLVKHGNQAHIVYYDDLGNEHWHEVDEKTVGEFTGLHDKNGKEIYEGDIIRRDFEIGYTEFDPVTLGATDYVIKDEGYFIGVVHYRPSEGFILNKCKKFNIEDEIVDKKSGVKIYSEFAEVIGNIYEHQHLVGDTHERP